MKKCNSCKEEKEFSEFYKSKRYKDGHYPSCKKCEIKRSTSYYFENKDEQSKKSKERYYKNQEFYLKKKREYDSKNREEVNKKAKERYHNNLDYAREYYKKNKERILVRNKKWIEENKDYFKRINSENTKKWLKKNPHIVVWRSILYRTIYKFEIEKESKTIELLGYSANDLKKHIESQFTEGMSWDNWGEWHIDHKYPLSLFDKDTPINIVNSLENLKPLWAIDNIRKGNKTDF